MSTLFLLSYSNEKWYNQFKIKWKEDGKGNDILITGSFREMKSTTNREMKALLPIIVVTLLVPFVVLVIQGGIGGIIFLILSAIIVCVALKVNYITAKDKMIKKLREF